VRNGYEWDVGRFEGARRPPCDVFAHVTPESFGLRVTNREAPVLLYCTGGIRCEYFGAMLRQRGFRQVYKLRGGVQHFGNSVGARAWHGRLFVFDRRDTVPVGAEGEAEAVGRCRFCRGPCEVFWNCANGACNRCFLACVSCATVADGCCSAACRGAPRCRPFRPGERRCGRGPGAFMEVPRPGGGGRDAAALAP